MMRRSTGYYGVSRRIPALRAQKGKGGYAWGKNPRDLAVLMLRLYLPCLQKDNKSTNKSLELYFLAKLEAGSSGYGRTPTP